MKARKTCQKNRSISEFSRKNRLYSPTDSNKRNMRLITQLKSTKRYLRKHINLLKKLKQTSTETAAVTSGKPTTAKSTKTSTSTSTMTTTVT